MHKQQHSSPSRSALPAAAALDRAIVQRAAEWMARLWSDTASDDDRSACAQWRAAHPDHERAWNRLQVVEDKLSSVPCDVARHALLAPAPAVGVTRRRALHLLGWAAMAGGLYQEQSSAAWQIATADHRTRTGEIREIMLPDGSRIVLATDTAIDVRFTQRERRIVLRAGEILVTTAPDPASVHRPLRVQSRQGMVEALGTRFTVRLDTEVTRVAVLQGWVEVRPLRAPDSVETIGVLQGRVFSGEQVQAPVAALESDAAWSKGVLVAENMRVADFVAELGRYRPGLLLCDPGAAELRVSGVFSLRDTKRALDNLMLALPVTVDYRTRYWAKVRSL